MEALGLVVLEKIFENCLLKTYFLTLWPTYATNQNHLNNFSRGPPSWNNSRSDFIPDTETPLNQNNGEIF